MQPTHLQKTKKKESQLLKILNIGPIKVIWGYENYIHLIYTNFWLRPFIIYAKGKWYDPVYTVIDKKKALCSDLVKKPFVSVSIYSKGTELPTEVATYLTNNKIDILRKSHIRMDKDFNQKLMLPLTAFNRNNARLPDFCESNFPKWDDFTGVKDPPYCGDGFLISSDSFGIFIYDEYGTVIWVENPIEVNDTTESDHDTDFKFELGNFYYIGTKYYPFYKSFMNENTEKNPRWTLNHIVDDILYVNYMLFFGKTEKAEQYLSYLENPVSPEPSRSALKDFTGYGHNVSRFICLILNQICMLDKLKRHSPKLLNIGKLKKRKRQRTKR